MCATPLHRTSEFQVLNDPATKTTTRRFGTCGPTANASALSSALGRIVSVQETYGWMRSHTFKNANGVSQYYCDESGASTLSANAICATALGATVIEASGYQNPWSWTAALAFLRRHAGINPIVFETSIGQKLVDSVTKLGENATNLQFHFPAILGYHSGGLSDFGDGLDLPEGCWVADGDNYAGGNTSANGFNATDVLQFYPMSVLQAAALVGALALKGRDVTLQIAQVGTFFAANADGSWHCKTTGKTLRGGMLDWYRSLVASGNLNGFTDLGLPMTDEVAVGSAGTDGLQPTIQVFERGAGAFDRHRVIDNPPGAIGDEYKTHLTHPVVLKAYGLVLASSVPPPPPAPVNVAAEVNAVLADLAKATTDAQALQTKLGSQAK